MRRSKEPEVRRAILALLRRGQVSVAEATMLAGVSHQTMAYWIEADGVDARRVREVKATELFRKEMARGPRLAERPNPKRKTDRVPGGAG